MKIVRLNMKSLMIAFLGVTAVLYLMLCLNYTLTASKDLTITNLTQEGTFLRSRFNIPEDSLRQSPAAQAKLHGIYRTYQQLAGMVFCNNTALGSLEGEIVSPITLSLVKSFSPAVVEHVKQIFADQHDECVFHATIPAMIRRGSTIEVVQRIWLTQYERLKVLYRNNGWDFAKMTDTWMNTWQENYLYHMVMDENYNLLKPGEILGIPTTTNVKFTYKSDGAMDPRLVSIGDNYHLLFHTWVADKNSGNEVSGRTHIWDMVKHSKKRLWPHIKLQKTEINWVPLELNGELYLTYSIDPLRIMKCETSTGDCAFIYQQEGTSEHPFVYSSDHLRGGTPWVVYKYPYYVSAAHSVVVTHKPEPDYSMYFFNLVVLSVEPWRVVYVSRQLQADPEWMASEPVVRNYTIIRPFLYPTGIIVWSDDIIDISCHLNDVSGHVVRLSGIKALMEQVTSRDNSNGLNSGPVVRVVQQYVLEETKNAFNKTWSFFGDIIEKTLEDPVAK